MKFYKGLQAWKKKKCIVTNLILRSGMPRFLGRSGEDHYEICSILLCKLGINSVLEQVAQSIFQSSFKNLQGWRFHSPFAQTVPVSLCAIGISRIATSLLFFHCISQKRFDLIFSVTFRQWKVTIRSLLSCPIFKLNRLSSFTFLYFRCCGSLMLLVAGLFSVS